jgi:hypothetical protein
MGRFFRNALLISVGVHLFFMTAVVIVNPAASQKITPFTRIEFLGPLLTKTAFDMMIEGTDPIASASYRMADGSPSDLKAAAPTRGSDTTEYPDYSREGGADAGVKGTLSDNKSFADFLVAEQVQIYNNNKGAGNSTRRIRYKPVPLIVSEKLEGPEIYRVKVMVLVAPDGTVRKTEPSTTSGYPRIDMFAARLVRSWLFEPVNDGKDELVTVDVELRAEGNSHD